ncbi:MAG: hypothetical protein HOB73_02535 [Planctomycetaceae bacterium]|jgi:hypothetical protein|nr:hypothetical protein [Planctomycetaceae bacterium]
MQMLKSSVVAFGGVVLAVILVSLVQQLGHVLFEVPAGLEGATPEETIEIIEAWMPTAPFGAIAMVLVSWLSGTYFGAWFAARFTDELPYAHAAPTICVMVLCALLMLLSLPHPLWMNVGSVLIVPAGLYGAYVGRSRIDEIQPEDQFASSADSAVAEGSDGGGSNIGADGGE